MKHEKFIPVSMFAENNNVTIGNVYAQKSYGSLPSWIFKKEKKSLFINENFIIRRKEFQQKIWRENQELYYETQEFITQNALATFLSDTVGRTISNWNNFMSYQMWDIANKSTIRYEVPERQLQFNRKIKAFLRSMKKDVA